MKFKVKDPFRKVELMIKSHLNFIKSYESDEELWSMLDHLFWETFDSIIKEENGEDIFNPKKKENKNG